MANKTVFTLMLLVVYGCSSFLSVHVQGNDEIPVPSSPTLPHEYIRFLIQDVDAMVEAKILTKGQGTSLNTKLDKAKSDLNRGDAASSVRYLESFKLEAGALVRGGVMPAIRGDRLVAVAAAAQVRIDDLAFGARFAIPAPPTLSGCAEREPCDYTTFYVDANPHCFLCVADGSPNQPFLTIADALERAAALGLCGVDVRVANGRYEGNLSISRGTRIVGESQERTIISGSILNNGGYELSVRRLTIRSSSVPAAIFAGGPCASMTITTVTDVLIDQAERYGIYQRGGTLTVLGAEIRDTRAQADTDLAGTAIYLFDGVRAALAGVEIHDSDSAGLVVTGAETRVYAVGLSVSGCSVNPDFRDDIEQVSAAPAAVEARDGALLLMEFCTIDQNEVKGLRVRDSARAHFRYGLISRSSWLAEWQSPHLGINVIADSGATLEMSHFTVTRDHDSVGLVLIGAYVSLSDGEVSDHAIGVNIQEYPPGFQFNDVIWCLEDEVFYRDNDVTLDAPDPPVPEPICGFSLCEPPPPHPTCHRVEFSCYWCRQGH